MKFFENYYSDVDFNKKETPVLCPFHNDTKPSAFINTEKSLFNCFVCNEGMSETTFMARVNNIPENESLQLLESLESQNKWFLENKARLWSDQEFLEKVYSLGLTNNTIETLDLGLIIKNGVKSLAFPVLYNGLLVDIRSYNIDKNPTIPKWQSQPDTIVGYLLPYDKFIQTKEKVYLVEGEKDMAIAREKGLNAYTLTGGSNAIPNKYVINAFKDKEVVICYDNDEAGIKGSENLAASLLKVAKSVKKLNISNFVKNEKEDIYDYFVKYDGSVFELLISEEEDFKIDLEYTLKLQSLSSVLKENKIKRKVSSKIIVSSEYVDTYVVPTFVEIKKIGEDIGKEIEHSTLAEGETRTFLITDKNKDLILSLIEVDAKAVNVKNKLLAFLGTTKNEANLEFNIKMQNTVYKYSVTDGVQMGSMLGIDLYTFERMYVGKSYIVDYKLVPHPTKQQKTVAVAFSVKEIGNKDNFATNKDLLNKFVVEGTIENKLDYLYKSAKHYIAKHLKFENWLMNDLVINSILDFNFGEKIRGALDVFIIGDTQVGKSETSSKLVDLYDFGVFLSLKTSTTVGLIGGSNKVDGSYCNTIGAVPRQNEGYVVMEEFSGAPKEFIKSMTDIRSSNELRIARASGELRVPCKLRMMTISNPINDENGNPRFLDTFPNGVTPIMELITSAEDVARYDAFMLVPKIDKRFNPFETSLDGVQIDDKAYKHKAQWIQTRKVENVVFEEGVQSYIWKKSEELNTKYACNFPLFGTTTDKKLARFCVALSSLILSVDSTYENIIVTKEIVDYVCAFFNRIYDNPTFNLKGYKQEYDSYNELSEADINTMNKVYSNNVVLIDHLSKCTKSSRNELRMISGLDGDKFNPIFNLLVATKMIRIDLDRVFPTNKFRKCYKMIDKSFGLNTNTGGMI